MCKNWKAVRALCNILFLYYAVSMIADTARKRVVISDQNLSPPVSFDAEFDGTESYDDDSNDKRVDGPRSWVSYVVLGLLFFSGLVGMGQILRASAHSDSIPRGPPIQYVEAPASVASSVLSRAPETPMLRTSKESDNTNANLNTAASNNKIYPTRPLKLPSIPALKSGEEPGANSPQVLTAAPPIAAHTTNAALDVKKSSSSVEELYSKLQQQIEEVRALKRSGVVMETSDKAKALIKELRRTCREYLLREYGPEPYYVEMSLLFPSTMPDFDTNGADGKILFKLGPIEHVPYSVFYFLELVKNWDGGSFHRPAGHVLQAQVKTRAAPLAFQEYSPHFPHNKHTLGYAGRPSGPGFYISTVNNVANHGPASQGSATEADACFGALVLSPEVLAVVDRLKKQPGGQKPHMFVSPPSNYIKIPSMKLITSRSEGGLGSLPSV